MGPGLDGLGGLLRAYGRESRPGQSQANPGAWSRRARRKPRRMLAARLAGDPADDIDFDDFDEETEDGFDYRETIDITPGGARLKKTVTFRRPRPTARQVARPRPVLPRRGSQPPRPDATIPARAAAGRSSRSAAAGRIPVERLIHSLNEHSVNAETDTKDPRIN